MNLKKSDKMIAIAGVIILIIAAIVIIMYVPDKDNGEPTPTKKEYEVTWIKDEGSLVIDEYVDKEGYNKPFTVTALDHPGSVITNVYVKITWDDDYTKGKIVNKGEDIVTTKIGLSGAKPETYTDTGSGNKTLQFSVFSKPSDRLIEDVSDSAEAQQQVEDEYADMNSASFDVEITWEQGEKLLTLRLVKLLNFFRDKGEQVKLEFTFEYYYPTVMEIEDDDENKESSMKDETWASTPYMSTNYLGYH
jgi:hypothetical protein